MPRGVWLPKSGWPAGSITEQNGKFRVEFRAKIHRQCKTFQTRKAAEEFRWVTSDRMGLTKNRIRRKVGARGVLEMQLHRNGKAWEGLLATFDEDDLDLVAQYNWSRSGRGYTRRRDSTKLSRFISPPPIGMVLDHINRDKSDDRKGNHRVVTQLENTRNQSGYKTNTSGYHGISELHSAYYKYWNTEKQNWGSSAVTATGTRLNDRDLIQKAEKKRDAMGVKTKTGKVPSIFRYACWQARISVCSPDGGTKSFTFKYDDQEDREKALQEAIVYRDYLQTRTNSSNGKPALVT